MINFALWWGKWLKKWEVVYLVIPESAKDFLWALHETILKAWGHPIIKYIPNGLNKHFYELASDEQLSFYAQEHHKGLANEIHHRVRVLAEHDKHELSHIDPQKIGIMLKANKKFIELLSKKELHSKFPWTLCLYGTPAMAKEAGMSLKEYRDQIIKVCCLDEADPVKKRKDIKINIEKAIEKLNNLKSGSGCNIPSFEIFTSPDWSGTNGWVKFNQPLYRHSQLIEGIELEFKNGVVTSFKAQKNQKFLEEIFKIANADKLWEFSLTDKRLSRITKFMAETLYDENVGGEFGNTHIAIWKSFHHAYFDTEAAKKFNKNDRKKLGFNDSAEHINIMSTSDRTVTATLENGGQKVIHRGGEFVV